MKHFRTLLLLVLLPALTCKCNLLYAQKQGKELVDSLLKELPKAKENTNKVKLLNGISFNCMLGNYDTGIKYGLQGLALAQTLKWKDGMAMCYIDIGVLYRYKAQYPDALEYLLKALKLYEEINLQSGIASANGSIGVVFQFQNKYNEAIKYETNSLNIYKRLGDKTGMAAQLGNIATLYWLKQEYDSALVLDFESLGIYTELNKEGEAARTNGNIGMIYCDAGNYAKALEYDFNALNANKKMGNRKRSLGIGYENIGEAYLKTAGDTMKAKAGAFIPNGKVNLLRKALAYTDSGITISKKLGDMYTVQEGDKNRAKISALLGDYKAAYEYYQQYTAIRDSVFSIENKVKIAKAEAKQELELKEKQIQIDQLALTEKQNEKWFLIASIFFLAIAGILFINRQLLRQKKLEAEKKNAETELVTAAKLLNNFKQSVHEKNSIIERITNELAATKAGELQQIDQETIARLESSIILTDEQWENFQALFEKVHKGFFRRVKEKMPDLTPAEIRFLALSKLKLSPKEMAGMLGISSNSIRNYRHRLRRKLGLNEEASIEEIADAI